MKLDRLLAMVMILINKKRVQAKDLAEAFEISVRTVYRDIETINQAGIPIVTYQGMNGGIGIADGYRLDKNVLTNDELAAIAVALRSVSTGYEDKHADAVLEKIRGIASSRRDDDELWAQTGHVMIDFSPWGDDSLQKAKVSALKEAIRTRSAVSFAYCSATGDETNRVVEPHTLVCKGLKWYLYAYCTLRQQFRLFKLSRIKNVVRLDRTFARRDVDLSDIPWEKEWFGSPQRITLVIRYDLPIRTVIEEWFGIEQTRVESALHGIASADLPENDWLYGFLLSLGPKAEVLEPPHIRHIVGSMAERIAAVYAPKQ